MIKILFAFALMASSHLLYAFDMKAGLWEVKTIIKSGGRTIDTSEQLKRAMAKMTPAQKKSFAEAMNKANRSQQFALDPANGKMKVCYSKESFSDPRSLLSKGELKACDFKIIEQSATKVKGNFMCKTGSKGHTEWILNGGGVYTSTTHMTDAKGRVTDIQNDGKFMSADCGKIRAITSVGTPIPAPVGK